jgi:hypothetical protein
MKTPIAKLLALTAVFTLAACSTVTVTTNYDHSAAFGKYKTYTLAPSPNGQKLSPRSEEVLRNAIRSQLAARGVKEAKTGKGDIAIVRHIFTQDKVTVRQYTDWGYGSGVGYGSSSGGGWPYAYGSYGMWAGAPSTYQDTSKYTEGTLVLDVVDTHTNKLVFRGTATALVGRQAKNASNIEKAVAKMVAALPVKR